MPILMSKAPPLIAIVIFSISPRGKVSGEIDIKVQKCSLLLSMENGHPLYSRWVTLLLGMTLNQFLDDLQTAFISFISFPALLIYISYVQTGGQGWAAGGISFTSWLPRRTRRL